MFDEQEKRQAKEGAAATLRCELRGTAAECGGKGGDEWCRRMLRQLGRIEGIAGWQANVTTGSLRYTEGMNRILGAGSVSSIRSIARLFFRESWKRLRESSRRAIDEQHPFELELEMKGGKGCCVWVLIFGEAFRGECNQIWLEGAIQDISDRKKIRAEIKTTNAARILAEEKLESASIAERRELAMEIHDGAGQILTAISLKTKLLHDLTEAGSPLRKNSSDLLEMVSRAQVRIRAISHGLAWQKVDRFNLVPALRHLLDSCAEGFDLATEYLGDEQIHFETDWEALHVFLIIQEAILNARRHSGASRLSIAAHSSSGHWRFRITDNGKGCDFESDRFAHFGIGISSMHNRARQCGGKLDIQSSPGKGTVVVLIIPISVCANEEPSR